MKSPLTLRRMLKTGLLAQALVLAMSAPAHAASYPCSGKTSDAFIVDSPEETVFGASGSGSADNFTMRLCDKTALALATTDHDATAPDSTRTL